MVKSLPLHVSNFPAAAADQVVVTGFPGFKAGLAFTGWHPGNESMGFQGMEVAVNRVQRNSWQLETQPFVKGFSGRMVNGMEQEQVELTALMSKPQAALTAYRFKLGQAFVRPWYFYRR